MTADDPNVPPSSGAREALERGSLGSPEAKALRALVDPGHARAIVQLGDALAHAETAESELSSLRATHQGVVERLTALARGWEQRLEGARQRANTGADFGEIADKERTRKECAADLRAALASSPPPPAPAVSEGREASRPSPTNVGSDGEGATSEACGCSTTDHLLQADSSFQGRYVCGECGHDPHPSRDRCGRPASPVVAPSATDEGGAP